MAITVVVPVRVVALDVREVVEDLAVGSAVFANLFVSLVQVSLESRAVEMTGHVDELDVRVLGLERGHVGEVLGDLVGPRARYLPAPGPHDDVDFRVSCEVGVGRVHPCIPLWGAQVGDHGVVGSPEVLIEVPHLPGSGAPLVAPDVGLALPALQSVHAFRDLAAVRSVRVEDAQLLLRVLDGAFGYGGQVDAAVVDDDGLSLRHAAAEASHSRQDGSGQSHAFSFDACTPAMAAGALQLHYTQHGESFPRAEPSSPTSVGRSASRPMATTDRCLRGLRHQRDHLASRGDHQACATSPETSRSRTTVRQPMKRLLTDVLGTWSMLKPLVPL